MASAYEAPTETAGRWRPGTVRGREGFFRVAQRTDGCWSLLGPEGKPFFAKVVHGAASASPAADRPLPPDSAGRLRRWGFNTLGIGADAGLREDGLVYVATADFAGTASEVAAPGVRLPDVFAADWPARVAEHAAAGCTLHRGDAALLGWITDENLAWGSALPGQPGLLQVCLSLEPSFAAYHAAWEFVLALHGGRLETLARAWGVPVPNKETVRDWTRRDRGVVSRGYLRDETRWVREWARRYFTATAAAIRAADPDHLVLGCRFRRAAPAAVQAECVYPAVDVAMPVWTDLPGTDSQTLHPVLAGEVAWDDPEFQRAPATGPARRLTSVERMLRRARTALDRMARHPAVVGYAWAQWQDAAGAVPPFGRGLVHADGTEAREHTELLAPFNARVENLRRPERVAVPSP